MGRGRPKGFDETEVVARAMELFWQKGYEGAGLSELLEHMGISRQSLYDTFGSKRELFIRAIEHYRTTQLAQALAVLEREGAPLDNVRAVVRFFEELALDARCRGCLVANTLVELGPHDVEVAALLHDTLGLLRSGIESALRRARERGELRSGRSPKEISEALTNALIGLAVTGRLRTPPETIREIHSGTLALLD